MQQHQEKRWQQNSIPSTRSLSTHTADSMMACVHNTARTMCSCINVHAHATETMTSTLMHAEGLPCNIHLQTLASTDSFPFRGWTDRKTSILPMPWPLLAWVTKTIEW